MADGFGIQDIGLGLRGFSAGVAGKGEEFLQSIRDQRKQALVQDAFTVRQQIESGDIPGARQTLLSRLDALRNLRGDPSDTNRVLKKLEEGNIKGALEDVGTVVEFAMAEGLLQRPPEPPQAPQAQRRIVDGQVVSIDPTTGQASAAPIEGFRQDPDAVRDRSLRERQIAVSEATEARQATKLSAGLEKALLTAQDETVAAQRSATEFEVLAQDFERAKLQGGVAATVSETFKNLLGSQDAVSEFRRRFNKVRLAQALKNLPTGPPTDKDLAEALKGVPKETASPEQVSAFLRGAARLARFQAGFNQFKADFISTKSTGKGLNQAWRRKVRAPVIKREVTIAEIYETAQNRNISPEEVREQLGIVEGIF